MSFRSTAFYSNLVHILQRHLGPCHFLIWFLNSANVADGNRSHVIIILDCGAQAKYELGILPRLRSHVKSHIPGKVVISIFNVGMNWSVGGRGVDIMLILPCFLVQNCHLVKNMIQSVCHVFTIYKCCTHTINTKNTLLHYVHVLAHNNPIRPPEMKRKIALRQWQFKVGFLTFCV